MKHYFFIYLLTLVSGSCSSLFAQDVELLFASMNTKQALKFKAGLKDVKITTFNALALRNASEVRTDAYLQRIATRSVVIILGKNAMISVEKVKFPMPVIIVDTDGSTAAEGAVFRILDANFDAGSVSGLITLSDPASLSFSLLEKKEMAIKCEGITPVDVVNKILSNLSAD